MSKGKVANGTAIKQTQMRRCVVCRQVRHKSELLRVSKSAEKISLDETGKAPGRGAYVCRSPQCVELIKKRRGLDRSFKVKVPDELYDEIKEIVLM
ncbi:MAG: YlxR family protein [Selenomonadaceae bacterium]|nr:YlxR family protein [Selenomonadaceae bacterium]